MKIPTVLYIDDDTELASGTGILLKLHLRDKGINTRILTSEALVTNYLKQVKEVGDDLPALAVVDLWMIDKKTNIPNPDAGFNVIRELRRQFPNIVLMVVSAHINQSAISVLSAYKMIGIIDKTVSPNRLIAKVEEALRAIAVL